MLGLDHLRLKETFNRRLTWTILLIALSQFNFGFDQQGFSATQAMDAFDKQFGAYDPEKKAYYLPTVWLSYFNSFMYAGLASGVIIGSFVSKVFGRRWCMFSMSLWALVAVTIVITSKSSDQILAGRVLNYIYIGMELSIVPIYQSEIVPQKARGFVVGTYQLSLTIGGLIINAVARGTGDMKSNAAWRIPFGLFYIVPTIVASGIWFCPESPRWLITKGRSEEALNSLRLLRNGKFTDEEIQEEFANMRAAVDLEVEKGTFLDLFRGRPNLKRTGIVIVANFFLQGTGQTFASVYGSIYIKSIGTVNPFTISCTNASISIVILCIMMATVDKVGRRKMLFFGGSVQVLALMAMGALGTVKNPSDSVKAGIIATMTLFVCGFQVGWAGVTHTISAEIPSVKNRDMLYRTGAFVSVCVQFATTFSLPYLLNAPYANLGSKVGFIFGSISFVGLIFVKLCVPDCSGRTLEEIDVLFNTGVPIRHFRTASIIQPADHLGAKDVHDDEHIEITTNKV